MEAIAAPVIPIMGINNKFKTICIEKASRYKIKIVLRYPAMASNPKAIPIEVLIICPAISMISGKYAPEKLLPKRLKIHLPPKRTMKASGNVILNT